MMVSNRLIIPDIPNVSVQSLEKLGLKDLKILRIWAIISMKKLLHQIDGATGMKVPSILAEAKLVHGENVFLEDRTHDWFLRDGNCTFFLA